MKPLKRAATMPKRPSLRVKSPSMIFILALQKRGLSPRSDFRLHVFDDFHAEPRQRIHALGRRQHAHLRHPEIGQNLRADAVGAQLLATLTGTVRQVFTLRTTLIGA